VRTGNPIIFTPSIEGRIRFASPPAAAWECPDSVDPGLAEAPAIITELPSWLPQAVPIHTGAIATAAIANRQIVANTNFCMEHLLLK
jgi:hypothetical protein